MSSIPRISLRTIVLSIAFLAVVYHLLLIFYPYTPFSYWLRIGILDLTQLIRATHVFFIVLVGYLIDLVNRRGVIRYSIARKGVALLVLLITLWITILLTKEIVRNPRAGSALIPLLLIYATWISVIPIQFLPSKYENIASLFNAAPAIISFAPYLYMVINYEELIYRGTSPLNIDIAMGWSLTLMLIAYILRHIGPEMPLLILLFMLYDIYGYYAPPPWNHPGFDVSFLIGKIYIETEAALWGVITNVSVKYIVYFFILAGTFAALGFERVMAKTFLSLMGRNPVNVGRVAVAMGVAMGMISGSGAADTAFIGTTLRNLFRRAGYDDLTAAGLTANAGTLAIVTPPILGAAAFVMVELLHIPYVYVAVMAAPLAVLYASSILMYNEFLVKRLRLDKHESIESDLGKRELKFHIFIPIAFIIVMIALGYSINLAVSIAVFIAILVALFDKELRQNIPNLPKRLSESFVEFTVIGASIVAANIIMAMVVVSGLHLKFSLELLNILKNNLALAIIFAAAFSLLLGMGVPPTATFVLSSILTAPIIIKLAMANDIPELAATYATYMFLFYMAMLADVTPPVALSAYAAAGVFGQDPIKTGVKAALVAIPKYIYAPAMIYSYLGTSILILPVLLAGTPLSQAIPMITYRFIEVVAGILFVSAGVGGYLFTELSTLTRFLSVIAGILLIIPGELTDIIGILIGAPIAIYSYLEKKRSSKEALRV